MTTTEPDAGLRERKKDATRRALSEAGMKLALERGYDAFTIADVAAEVGVSRRTFSNYFAGKAECVVGACEDWLFAILGNVQHASREHGLVSMMIDLVVDLDATVLDGLELFGQLLRAQPELQGQTYATDQLVIDAVAQELAAMLTAQAQDIRIQLIATYALAASHTCLERWFATGRNGGREGLRELMNTAMSVIDAAAIEQLASPAHDSGNAS